LNRNRFDLALFELCAELAVFHFLLGGLGLVEQVKQHKHYETYDQPQTQVFVYAVQESLPSSIG
jgi:hypothetical protein